MRSDALGFFWEDKPPEPKQKKAKIKKTPPNPVWLQDDYLPYLEEALAFNVELMTFEDLQESIMTRDTFIYDVECSPNYFLASFKSARTKKVLFVEAYEDHTKLDRQLLAWILSSIEVVTFNGNGYDIPVSLLAVAGHDLETLKEASDLIIQQGLRPREIYKYYKLKNKLVINHIDLIEVAPLRANLKIYGGRLHTKKMQDLPFHHAKRLNLQQVAIVRWYNIDGDLPATLDLYNYLKPDIELRITLGHEVGLDLRSKSDPQVAEAYIGQKLSSSLGKYIRAPKLAEDASFYYRVPHFIQFKTPLLNQALDIIKAAEFKLDWNGEIINPFGPDGLVLNVGTSSYTLKIGGLHSREKKTTHTATATRKLYDTDVVSYYPMIVLICGLFPQHLTSAFLHVFKAIVDRRILAKSQKLTKIANSLKILINGTFGKLGESHSIFYSPDLLIQVTMTGQLCLLMLIEAMELAGIPVVSANTDGIVTAVDDHMLPLFKQTIADWEMQTGFKTEEAQYKSLHSRDVNNYFAIKKDGSLKYKGAYSNPWSAKNEKGEGKLVKNPTCTICIDAIEEYFDKGIPPEVTIKQCRDITKFLTVRTVKSGAVKVWEDGSVEFIGKAVRWYYAENITGEIVAAATGNKVPRSDGAKPLLVLPETLPTDINYNWYIKECEDILEDVGYV